MSADKPDLLGTMDPRVRLRTIGIKKLRLDFHPREGLNKDILAQYVEKFIEGAPVEPVKVYFDGDAYYLAEGFHRVAAAKMGGRKMILADVRWGTRADVEAEVRKVDD